MRSPYILLKILNRNGKMVQKTASRATKSIFSFLEAGKFQDCVFYLCVTYRKDFQNAGIYKTKKELVYALKAFTEKELLKDV